MNYSTDNSQHVYRICKPETKVCVSITWQSCSRMYIIYIQMLCVQIKSICSKTWMLIIGYGWCGQQRSPERRTQDLHLGATPSFLSSAVLCTPQRN
ncbi:hypothetical protein AV530_000582 [Patagioenas fasciata monilis]|uniref:Uncharacterized protein n=1 Tax=Patagioenas fasciata monilis TaxID=372326 RepID=A0A1V4IH18_PATFA|nr:hypothetical protein AV530_000582 [Patagioenas fasciata monilis]